MKQSNTSLERFKQSLDTQGFISPMLSALPPREVLRRPPGEQEIFGMVLDGDLELKTQNTQSVYAKHEVFFIDGTENFEIHSGNSGVEYLFAFKNNRT